MPLARQDWPALPSIRCHPWVTYLIMGVGFIFGLLLKGYSEAKGLQVLLQAASVVQVPGNNVLAGLRAALAAAVSWHLSSKSPARGHGVISNCTTGTQSVRSLFSLVAGDTLLGAFIAPLLEQQVQPCIGKCTQGHEHEQGRGALLVARAASQQDQRMCCTAAQS